MANNWKLRKSIFDTDDQQLFDNIIFICVIIDKENFEQGKFLSIDVMIACVEVKRSVKLKIKFRSIELYDIEKLFNLFSSASSK